MYLHKTVQNTNKFRILKPLQWSGPEHINVDDGKVLVPNIKSLKIRLYLHRFRYYYPQNNVWTIFLTFHSPLLMIQIQLWEWHSTDFTKLLIFGNPSIFVGCKGRHLKARSLTIQLWERNQIGTRLPKSNFVEFLKFDTLLLVWPNFDIVEICPLTKVPFRFHKIWFQFTLFSQINGYSYSLVKSILFYKWIIWKPLHSKRANTLETMSADLKNKFLGKWITNMFSTFHFENVVNTPTTINERKNIY